MATPSRTSGLAFPRKRPTVTSEFGRLFVAGIAFVSVVRLREHRMDVKLRHLAATPVAAPSASQYRINTSLE
jgi:hypothetical protein